MTSAVVPYIPVDAPDELKEYAKKAIVRVTHRTFPKRGKDGTTFFIRYETEIGEICHGLMTNHHVINFDHDEPITEDGVIYDGKPPEPQTVLLSSEKLQFTKELKLEELSIRYAFSSSRLDVTLLEFSQKEVDEFKEKGNIKLLDNAGKNTNTMNTGVVYLEMKRDVSASYGDSLHIYGHPGGGQLCKGEGHLVGQPTPLICYSVDTAPGFSGSPIFKVVMVDRRTNSFRYQLVGIHHRAGVKEKYNCGTPIETVFRAIDRDRPIALQDGARYYPRKQTEDAEADLLIQYLFEADLAVATEFETRPFIHTKYYNKPRLYEISSDKVKMTLWHSLECDQFTLMDVLDGKHLAVPWRDWDFSLQQFNAFYKLTVALHRVCSLEISEYTGRIIVTRLEGHLREILNNFSLAGYYGRDGNDKHQMTTIQKLKWAVMSKDGPRHLVEALLKTEGVHSKDHLAAKLNQLKCNEATEVELIETIAVCLTAITSQMRTLGRPPAALKTHVQRTDAVDELSILVKQSFEEEPEGSVSAMWPSEKASAVSVWGMGGLGKTRLVLDVVQSSVVQKVFPNLIWHEVGKVTDTILEDNLKKLAEAVGAESGNYMENNINAIKRKLRETQFKETLLVIDNVWSSDTAMNFVFDFPTIFTSRVRLVFDTNHKITSYQMPNGFKPDETTELFEKCMKTNGRKASSNEKAVEINDLHSFCGGHPLVIAILTRNIAKKIRQGETGWEVIGKMKEAGLKVVELAEGEPISEERHRNVFVMLTTLVQTMKVNHQNCLHALRICKRGAKLTRGALKSLFKGVVVDGVFDRANEADYLSDQALLQEEQPNMFTVHDVIFDLITQTETTDADINCHKEFIRNFELDVCPLEQVPQRDAYMTMHCGYHLLKANLKERWVDLFVHNIDFLVAVAACGIDLHQEFSVAECLFFEEEVRLKENDDRAQTNAPLLPQVAVSVYLASLLHRAKSKLKPRENAHTAFMMDVSQTLLKLIERYGNNCDIESAQQIAIVQITRMLSKSLFANFRRQNAVTTRSDSKLALYRRATEMMEKGLTLITAIKRETKPAEIQRLLSGMQLTSFFQTDEDGETCMHAAVRHEQPAVIFDILKNAEVWNQQSTPEEHRKILNAVEMLKIAGSNALLELYRNVEEELHSEPPRGPDLLFEVLKTSKIELKKYLLSTLAPESDFCGMTSNVALAVLQSFVFQANQFAFAYTQRWKKSKRINDFGDETSNVFGIWFIFAFGGIRNTLVNLCCDNLASENNTDLSWKGLISAQATPVNPVNIDEETVLYFASAVGSVDIVTKLLSEASAFGKEYHQTFINHQSRMRKWTALHAACFHGHLSIVNHLLANSADLLTKTATNDTPLLLAARRGHPDIVESLLAHLKKKINQPVFEKYLNHHDSVVGRTALHWACIRQNVQTVKQLIHHSPDLCKEDNENWTCLHYSVEKGNYDIVELLLAKEGKGQQQKFINHRTNQGVTALQMAGNRGYHKVVDVLLNYSADYLNADNGGDTGLQDAVLNQRFAVVQQLLKHVSSTKGQDDLNSFVDHQNNKGETALHQACNMSSLEIVNVLLSHFPDCSLQDDCGDTCLQNAVLRGHSAMAECLVKHVTNYNSQNAVNNLINHQNNHELTVIDMAFSFNRKQVMQSLLDSCTAFGNADVEVETYLRLRARLRASKWRQNAVLNNRRPMRPRSRSF